VACKDSDPACTTNEGVCNPLTATCTSSLTKPNGAACTKGGAEGVCAAGVCGEGSFRPGSVIVSVTFMVESQPYAGRPGHCCCAQSAFTCV
jgi:hypothetical protein